MPPEPKHPDLRANRNKATTKAELVVRDHPDIPDMPERYRIGAKGKRIKAKWHPEAIANWIEIWSSPMAEEFVDADMGGIRELIALIDDQWKQIESGAGVKVNLSADIARRRASYGLNPMARRSLQWRKSSERKKPEAIDVTSVELPDAKELSDGLYED